MLVERKRKVCRKVLSHEGLRSSSALSGSIAAHRARARFLFCERARSGMPTCKFSTSPPSRELGNVEPGEAPAKNCFARTATQTVWCAKTGTALNDERDSGSFESPPRREMRMKAQGGRAGKPKMLLRTVKHLGLFSQRFQLPNTPRHSVAPLKSHVTMFSLRLSNYCS